MIENTHGDDFTAEERERIDGATAEFADAVEHIREAFGVVISADNAVDLHFILAEDLEDIGIETEVRH